MLEADVLTDKNSNQETTLVDQLRAGLEYRVLELVITGYKNMHDKGNYGINWKENKFTAVLRDHMHKQIKSLAKLTNKNWYIEREHYLDNDEIVSGDGNPDTAPRIDIVICTWTANYDEIIFPFECKVLAANKSHLIRFYIKNGIIDRYLNDKNYSKGSNWGGMIGYVIEGSNKEVIQKLNEQLAKQLPEEKTTLEICGGMTLLFEAIYKSVHQRSSSPDPLTITHILLPFFNSPASSSS